MNNIVKVKRIVVEYEAILVSVVVLAIVFTFSFVFLKPQVFRTKQIFSKEKTMKERLKLLEEKDRALSLLDYQFYKEVYPKVIQVLPEGKDYVSLFNTFDNLEKDTGVSIVRADFQLGVVSIKSTRLTKSKSSKAFTLPITIEVIGNVSQIKRFIEATRELSGRLITIDDVKILFQEDDILSAQFNGNVYFYPLQTSIGKLDSPLPRLSQKQDKVLNEINSKVGLVKAETGLKEVPMGKKNLFQ